MMVSGESIIKLMKTINLYVCNAIESAAGAHLQPDSATIESRDAILFCDRRCDDHWPYTAVDIVSPLPLLYC